MKEIGLNTIIQKNNRLASLNDIRIIDLPKNEDLRGNLTFIENYKQIPFEMKRIYWIYDVPGGQVRGGHAFKEQQEFIIALSGSFNILIDDGFEKETVTLCRSYYGLYLPAGLWREMNNFSTNSLAVILSSTLFHQNDYIREYKHFLSFRANHET